MQTQARREVAEAVLIAALCTLVTEGLSWAVQEMRRKQEQASQRKKKGKKAK